jgi:hypothetical protein
MSKQCEYCGTEIEQFARNTKKYCNDTCKQLAYYSRQGNLQHTVNSSFLNGTEQEDLAFSVNEETEESEIEQPEESPGITKNSIKPEAPVKPKEQPVSVKETAHSQTVNVQPYQWIESNLVQQIVHFEERINNLYVFTNSAQHWYGEQLKAVKWVSLRLRCLIENILRLSLRRTIPRQVHLQLVQAFIELRSSKYYTALPSNYPLHELANEAADLTGQQLSKGQQSSLELSLYFRAKLTHARYYLCEFVPKVKFSQIAFIDPETKAELEKSEKRKRLKEKAQDLDEQDDEDEGDNY